MYVSIAWLSACARVEAECPAREGSGVVCQLGKRAIPPRARRPLRQPDYSPAAVEARGNAVLARTLQEIARYERALWLRSSDEVIDARVRAAQSLCAEACMHARAPLWGTLPHPHPRTQHHHQTRRLCMAAPQRRSRRVCFAWTRR